MAIQFIDQIFRRGSSSASPLSLEGHSLSHSSRSDVDVAPDVVTPGSPGDPDVPITPFSPTVETRHDYFNTSLHIEANNDANVDDDDDDGLNLAASFKPRVHYQSSFIKCQSCGHNFAHINGRKHSCPSSRRSSVSNWLPHKLNWLIPEKKELHSPKSLSFKLSTSRIIRSMTFNKKFESSALERRLRNSVV